MIDVEVSHKELLLEAFKVGVDACRAERRLPALLPTAPIKGRNIILGAGKAGGAMAVVAAKHFESLGQDYSGLVVTRYGHSSKESAGNIEVVESGHPVPDENSYLTALRVGEIAEKATADDRVIFLISGGGSSLLSCPADGISVEDKRQLNIDLVQSGASIMEINFIRSHFSKIKGGRLARLAHPAQMFTYVISDVVGDDPKVIASGPTIETEYDPERVLGVLLDYNIELSPHMCDVLKRRNEKLPISHPVETIATSNDALNAIEAYFAKNGWSPVLLGNDIEGDATIVGEMQAETALEYRKRGGKFALISGGELTVRVKNKNGCGGPNLEYLTSLMVSLDGAEGIEAIACDSDGIDGSEDNAGGYMNAGTLEQLKTRGLNPLRHLAQNLTYKVFDEIGGLIKTGPTLTNVNDIRIILVDG